MKKSSTFSMSPTRFNVYPEPLPILAYWLAYLPVDFSLTVNPPVALLLTFQVAPPGPQLCARTNAQELTAVNVNSFSICFVIWADRVERK